MRWIFQHSAANLGAGAHDGREEPQGDGFVQEEAERGPSAVFRRLTGGYRANSKTVLTMKMNQHWDREERELPFLEVFGTLQDMTLSNLIQQGGSELQAGLWS